MDAKIFISYRRKDSGGYAGRLQSSLVAHFGREKVFIDDRISVGEDFVERLERELAQCSIAIVMIGERWLGEESGKRRIDDPGDYVRMELARALARSILVVPILVDDAHMPKGETLPGDIRMISRRHALPMRNSDWDRNMTDLIERIEAELRTVKRARPAQSPSTAPQRIPLLAWAAAGIVALVATGAFLQGPSTQPTSSLVSTPIPTAAPTARPTKEPTGAARPTTPPTAISAPSPTAIPQDKPKRELSAAQRELIDRVGRLPQLSDDQKSKLIEIVQRSLAAGVTLVVPFPRGTSNLPPAYENGLVKAAREPKLQDVFHSNGCIVIVIGYAEQGSADPNLLSSRRADEVEQILRQKAGIKAQMFALGMGLSGLGSDDRGAMLAEVWTIFP